MKNLIIIFSLIASSYASAFDVKYVSLETNKTKSVDVANSKNVVTFKWDVKSTNGFTVPTAKVLEESGDFQCQIANKILKFSGFDANAKVWSQTWEIKVQWQPGTDQSGCLIEVAHPDEGVTYGELYMNYDL